MSQYKSQVQNQFLSGVRKRHQPVEVVLNTGTSLRGKIKGYDQFSVTLIFKEKTEVIYKSSILFISALPRKIRPPGRFAGPSGAPGPRREFHRDGPPSRDFTPREGPPRDVPPRSDPTTPPPAPPREGPPKDDPPPRPKRPTMIIDDTRDPPPPRKIRKPSL